MLSVISHNVITHTSARRPFRSRTASRWATALLCVAVLAWAVLALVDW